MNGLELGLGVLESTTRPGTNDDVLVCGHIIVQANTSHGVEQPLPHRSKRVMVEGVHSRILEPLFLGPSIPALPDRCGPISHRIQPAGKRVLKQKLISNIDIPRLSERGCEVADTYEPGAEVVAFGSDVIREVFGSGRAFVLGQQIKSQGEHVTGLGVTSDASIVRNVGFVKCAFDLLEELLVFGDVR